MLRLLKLLFVLLVRSVRSRRNLILENLALWQQLAVLKLKHPQPRLAAPDKLFWVILRRIWPGWKRALPLERMRKRWRAGHSGVYSFVAGQAKWKSRSGRVYPSSKRVTQSRGLSPRRKLEKWFRCDPCGDLFSV